MIRVRRQQHQSRIEIPVFARSSNVGRSTTKSTATTVTRTVRTTATRLLYTPFPENLYREWTLEQDQLLRTNIEKPSSELAVLLGRGVRGVEKRIEKLKDVDSSAYQRLFVGEQKSDGDEETSHESQSQSQSNQQNNNKSKKSKLIPSSEVLRRIEWDYQLDGDDFKVMHYDRVEDTIVTSPLTAPNKSISSGETSMIKALPEHRIMAILYRERVVWDRRNNRKHDVFFGPPGILAIAETYEAWKCQKDAQLEEQNRLRLAWQARWVDLLMGSTTEKDRLVRLTEDLLASDGNSDGHGDIHDGNSDNNPHQTFDDGTGGATIQLTTDQQQGLDIYIHNTFELFRAVENGENTDIDIDIDTAKDTDANSDRGGKQIVVSLFDELSEWIASPCWSSFEYDDIGKITECTANLLRETLLRKLSSTMGKLEGKASTKHKPPTALSTKSKKKNSQQQKILLNENEVEETFVRGSGSGGQKINKTSNRVVLVHRPTGIRVECQDTRSLQQNRKIGRKRLLEKLDSHYRGSDSKEQRKQQKIQQKKKKTKSKNKSRLAAKQDAKRQKKAERARQQQEEEDNFVL